jgi:hypothetical protein
MSNGALQWMGEQAVALFRLPLFATSAGVRKSGAFGIGLGFLLLGASILLLVALNNASVEVSPLPRWAILVVFPGLAFMIVGGYRLIAGREPEDASSLRRIVLGVAGGLFALMLLLAALVIAVIVSEALKR